MGGRPVRNALAGCVLLFAAVAALQSTGPVVVQTGGITRDAQGYRVIPWGHPRARRLGEDPPLDIEKVTLGEWEVLTTLSHQPASASMFKGATAGMDEELTDCSKAAGERYTLQEGQDSDGEVLLTVLEHGGNWAALAEMCDATPLCVAFSTIGQLKAAGRLSSATDATLAAPCTGVFSQDDPFNWLGFHYDPQQARLLREQVGQGSGSSQSRRMFQNRGQITRGGSSPVGTAPGVTPGTTPGAAQAAAAPTSWDSRDSTQTGGVRLMTPVRDQQTCGTCVPFSGGVALEAARALRLKRNADGMNLMSVQFPYFCTANGAPSSRNCNSGMTLVEYEAAKAAFKWENCYPYQWPQGSTVCGQPQCSGVTGPSGTWNTIRINSVEEGKAAIRQYGAVQTVMHADAAMSTYSAGILPARVGPPSHAVLVVGYNDAQRYWIVRNSWGSNWGMSGYFYISYNDPNLMTSYPFSVAFSYTPGPSDSLLGGGGGGGGGGAGVNVGINGGTSTDTGVVDNVNNKVAPQGPATVQCSAVFYSLPNMQGTSLAVSTAAMAAGEGKAYLIRDLAYPGTTQENWSRRMRSFSLRCDCTNTPNGCFELAQNVKVKLYTATWDTFSSTPGALKGIIFLSATDCSITDCSASGGLDAFDLKVASLALAYNMESLDPPAAPTVVPTPDPKPPPSPPPPLVPDNTRTIPDNTRTTPDNGVTTGTTLFCSATVYDGPTLTGQGVTLSFARPVQTTETTGSCWPWSDLLFPGATSWANRIRSVSLTCTCEGAAANQCFSFAKLTKLHMWGDTFARYQPRMTGYSYAQITDPAACTANRCTTQLTLTRLDRSVESMALCFKWDFYTPLNSG